MTHYMFEQGIICTFLDQKCYYFMVRNTIISATKSNHIVYSHCLLYYEPFFDLLAFFLRLGNV